MKINTVYIPGINDNQTITYTGREVVLVGNLKVATNSNNIKPQDLNVTWYDENGNVIDRPVNVGRYSVQYSYSDIDYTGNLSVNFEIAKARSGYPVEAGNTWETSVGNTLSSIAFSTPGLEWQNANTVIKRGTNPIQGKESSPAQW